MGVDVIVVVVLMLAISLFGLYTIKVGKQTKEMKQANRIKSLTRFYKLLDMFFLTHHSLKRVHKRLVLLCVYSYRDLQLLSAEIYIFGTGISMAFAVAVVFLYQDTISRLLGIGLAVILQGVLIDKKIDKTHGALMKEMAVFISSVRQYYLKSGSIAEAIGEAEVGVLLRKPVDDILAILTEADGELKLQKFYESIPFRTLQVFASVSYTLNNSGDTVDNYGVSSYVQALTSLTGDINAELERLDTQKKTFGVLEYLPLAAVPGVRVVEYFFVGIIPGTAIIYNGPIGYLSRMIIIVTAILGYSVVARLNFAVSIKLDDRPEWCAALYKMPLIRAIVNDITPKNAKRDKLQLSLQEALSKLTPELIYTQKLVFGVVGFAVALLAVTSMVSLSRDFFMESTQQLSLVSTDEMAGVKYETVKRMDEAFMERALSGDSMSDTEIRLMVRSYIPSLSDLQALDQVKRLKDKAANVLDSYFKWFYMLIAWGVAVVAWFIPTIMIKVRNILVQTEAEDDFLALQTLVSILMNTGLDTMSTLQQLAQNSRVHKDILLYCYHCYPSNPELELARLKARTTIIPFRRFVEKLSLTISDLSLAEAFSDLAIEREHILRLQIASNMATLQMKRSLCSPLAMAPIALTVVGALLIPLGVLGFTELMNAMSML